MAEAAARALHSAGIQQLHFINRTYARAEKMALEFSGQTLNWSQLPDALVMADVVVTVTGAPHVVIHASEVAPVLADRAGRPLHIVDIAVPRDVEESVGDLPGVKLYDIDHLQGVVDANLSQRQAAIPEVEAIVFQETTRFDDWLQSRQVLPVLVELRHKAKHIANSELKRQERRLGEMADDDREMINQLVHRVVNKFLHEPTVRLKAAAAEGNGMEYAHTLRDLFALESAAVSQIPKEKTSGSRRELDEKKGQQSDKRETGDAVANIAAPGLNYE
jgi:glutamyl-tRNA reductase